MIQINSIGPKYSFCMLSSTKDRHLYITSMEDKMSRQWGASFTYTSVHMFCENRHNLDACYLCVRVSYGVSVVNILKKSI